MSAAEASSPKISDAWLSLWLNILVLPGLGTLFLGQWLLGSAQVLLCLVGFSLALAEARFTDVAGLGLLAVALLWSVGTAMKAVNAAKDAR